jgi:hypothetical protein
MSIDAIKNAIVEAVNLSKFQVNFIENNTLEVERPTKYAYKKVIKGSINGEEDIGKWQKALTEEMD